MRHPGMAQFFSFLQPAVSPTGDVGLGFTAETLLSMIIFTVVYKQNTDSRGSVAGEFGVVC